MVNKKLDKSGTQGAGKEWKDKGKEKQQQIPKSGDYQKPKKKDKGKW